MSTVAGWTARRWWLVLLGWTVIAVGGVLLAPPFAEVGTFDEAAYLPPDSLARRGAEVLEATWPDDGMTRAAVVVLVREEEPLSEADVAVAREVAGWARSPKAPHGLGVVTTHLDDPNLADILLAHDGHAMLLLVELEVTGYSPEGAAALDALRDTIHRVPAPEGLERYLTGTPALGLDEQRAMDASVERTQILTIVLVLGLLLFVLRAPLAALIPLVTVGAAYLLSLAVVSWFAAAGLEVSYLYQTFAIVIVFGAGTDYSLLILTRYAEELERGDRLPPVPARVVEGLGRRPATLVATMAVLGGTLASSAASTAVGFSAQGVARFGLFRTMGPALAVTIGLTLLAGLTLTPALVRASGHLLFWPTGPRRPTRVWDRVAGVIARRPGRVLAMGLVPVLLPLLALPALRSSHDTIGTLPQDTESVQGLRALDRHLPAGQTAPVIVVVSDSESVFRAGSFRALADLSRNLRRVPGVASVRSVAMPTDGRRPDLDAATAGRIDELSSGLREAADAAAALADGITQLAGGASALRGGIDELTGGLQQGMAESQAGLADARAGAAKLRTGLDEARGGVTRLRQGVAALEEGVAAAQAGVSRLQRDVAAPAEDALRRAAQALTGFTLGRTDPRYPEAAEAVGEAHARITGRYPPGHPQAGQPVEVGYGGLAHALGELAAGLGDARGGILRLAAGLAELEGGLGEAVAGAAALEAGLAGAASAPDELTAGLAELQAGAARLDRAAREELLPGAQTLAAGLAQGAADLDQGGIDLPADLAGTEPFVLTTAFLDAAPELRDQLTFFTSDRDRRTRLLVGLEDSPFSDGALQAARDIEQMAALSLRQSPLEDAEVLVTGSAAFLREVDDAAARDFPVIVTAVIIGVFLVIAVLLRSLVVPLYMVLSVLLSYGAALGATVAVYQGVLGEPGLQWWLPPMLFVLLVALGVDYSIFLMGRVREEAQGLVTRDAVVEGIRGTGRVITSCGVILAGTFAVLVTAPLRSLGQLGFAAAVGILLDTFVVRALLVPSLAVLLGRHNWWPSSRARAA